MSLEREIPACAGMTKQGMLRWIPSLRSRMTKKTCAGEVPAQAGVVWGWMNF